MSGINRDGPAGTRQALLASNPQLTPSAPVRLDALEAGHLDHEGRIQALEAHVNPTEPASEDLA